VFDENKSQKLPNYYSFVTAMLQFLKKINPECVAEILRELTANKYMPD